MCPYTIVLKKIYAWYFKCFNQKSYLTIWETALVHSAWNWNYKSLSRPITMYFAYVSYVNTKNHYLALCNFTTLNHVFVVINCILHVKCLKCCKTFYPFIFHKILILGIRDTKKAQFFFSCQTCVDLKRFPTFLLFY